MLDQSSAPVFHREGDRAPRRGFWALLVGQPLRSAEAPHQTVGKAIGLAIFASDALSSTAYATQEMMVILAAVGMSAFHLAFPISLAIFVLLWIVTISYEQTIHSYPGGGGAYIVARDNLGEGPALTAGAALLTDYILTVAVSISSGVAQIASAYPALYDHRVEMGVAVVLVMTLLNLRGVRESGAVLAVPSYYFVLMLGGTLVYGLIRQMEGNLGTLVDPPEMVHPHRHLEAVTAFLVLHAFSSGTAALTGVEAISNGITAFREPRSRNAGITLLWMSTILGAYFVGISYLSVHIHAVPSETETVISQMARTVYGGRNLPYYMLIWATTIILLLAANTAYAGFPRLSALMAEDGFLPRQLAFVGSRLVFSRGIVALALLAAALIVAFRASVTNLIPLYAIGVFLSFTLAQAGMALRWRRSSRLKPGDEIRERGSVLRFDPRWLPKMLINGFGSICTFVVMWVFAVTKFSDGAWIVVIVIPALVAILAGIHKHYRNVAARLSLEEYSTPPRVVRHRVVLPISGVHRGTLAALHYARSLSDDVTAVHVSIDDEDADRLRAKWHLWGDGVRLVILESPYRLLLEPMVQYVRELIRHRQPNEVLTIVVPQFVSRHWWQGILHTQTAWFLRLALLFERHVVITDVPYLLDDAPRGNPADRGEERS